MSYVIKDAEGQPLLHGDKEIKGADFVGCVKAVDLKKRTLTIIGSDESRDRDGDIIRVNGWILDYYKSNPVFLWAHNYSSVPLGATSQITRRKNPPRLEFQDIRFPTEGLNPFADMILNLYGEKIINASSVGFIPYTFQELTEESAASAPSGGDRPVRWGGKGIDFLKQELLELSGCAVPSNPGALQLAIKGITSPNKDWSPDDLVKFLVGEMGIPTLRNEDDILEELRIKQSIEFIDEDQPVQVQVPVQIETSQEESIEEPEEKSICGSKSLPTDSSDSWDGAAAKANIKKWASDADGNIDFSKYKKGFVYQNSSADASTVGAYKLPFADVVSGKLTAVWGGVSAAMGAVNGARGGADLGDDKKSCYNFLASYYKKFDKTPPEYNASIVLEVLISPEVAQVIQEGKEIILLGIREGNSLKIESVLAGLEPIQGEGLVSGLTEEDKSWFEETMKNLIKSSHTNNPVIPQVETESEVDYTEFNKAIQSLKEAMKGLQEVLPHA
jgi:uncharacterized protein